MSTQSELFTPQAHARKTDGPESHAAAASVGNITATQEWILYLLRNLGPMQDESLVTNYIASSSNMRPEASPSGIRSRRAELVRAGKLRKSERIAQTKSGRWCAVWEVVP